MESFSPEQAKGDKGREKIDKHTDTYSTETEGAHLSPFTPGLLHISKQQIAQTKRFSVYLFVYQMLHWIQ